MEDGEIGQMDGLLLAILDNSYDGVVYYKTLRNGNAEIIDFIFKYMNDSAMKHLRGNKTDYLGKTFLQLFPANIGNGLFNLFRNTADTGVPGTDTYFYDEGAYRGWYKNSVVKYKDGIIVYFNDDTEKTELYKQLSQKTEQLEKLLTQKETLLKETHHRVKNNMQIIASLLSLQSKSINDDKFVEAFEIAKQRINTMALIHDKLYKGKNFNSIDLESFIYDIISTVGRFYDGIIKLVDYEVKADKMDVSIGTCINIGLILNELLTNSYKHAFKGRSDGRIKISAKYLDPNIHLCVADNGPGFPKGFDFENGTTLGLIIVQSLVAQMNGIMKISSDNGCAFSIIFRDKTLTQM